MSIAKTVSNASSFAAFGTIYNSRNIRAAKEDLFVFFNLENPESGSLQFDLESAELSPEKHRS